MTVQEALVGPNPNRFARVTSTLLDAATVKPRHYWVEGCPPLTAA